MEESKLAVSSFGRSACFYFLVFGVFNLYSSSSGINLVGVGYKFLAPVVLAAIPCSMRQFLSGSFSTFGRQQSVLWIQTLIKMKDLVDLSYKLTNSSISNANSIVPFAKTRLDQWLERQRCISFGGAMGSPHRRNSPA